MQIKDESKYTMEDIINLLVLIGEKVGAFDFEEDDDIEYNNKETEDEDTNK